VSDGDFTVARGEIVAIAREPQKPVRRLSPWSLSALAALGIAAVIGLWSFPAIPQSLSYHHFADDRTLLGVPNLLNVVSNVPFLIVGVGGLCFVLRRREDADSAFLDPAERRPFMLFFAGVGLTAFGSAYYHLHPDNDRLVWDRLPMAVAFVSLFAAVLAERIDVRLGTRLLAPLVMLGIGSALYWHWTEQQGRGDLRPYYFVQFYPILALPLMLLLLPPRYTRTGDFFIALGWYIVAKVCEHPGDAPIFSVGHVVSGHTLKHLAAAAGVYWILRMLQRRRGVVKLGRSASVPVRT
jgi:hypothetical protein